MSKSILIVEDHPDALEFFEELLTECGYDIVTAENGRKGLTLAEAGTFDALILDVNLPQMGGREIFTRLRSQAKFKKLPILFITAEQGDDVKDLLAQPHTYYMKKAIDVNALKELLTKVLK